MAKKNSTEYDSPWKDIIEHFFEDFMEFFFPEAHEKIDWTCGYEFLDKELQKVVREAVTKERRVDKLVKVWLKNGQQTLLYIHIEEQAQYDSDFPESVFIYHYRLYDRYGPLVTSLVILGDDQETWRPRSYHYETIGSELSFCFSMVKLLDYQDKWDELEQSRNPFAMVVRVHLKGLETQKFPPQRLDEKIALFQALHQENYSDKEIMGLLVFLDWVLTLPEGLTLQFKDFVHQYEEAKKVRYVTSFERLAILQQSRQDVTEVLNVRFQQVPNTLVERIQAINDSSLLSKLLKEAVLVESLERFEKQVKGYTISE
jgi:hypothetical protein